jgi:hypothetical protein
MKTTSKAAVPSIPKDRESGTHAVDSGADKRLRDVAFYAIGSFGDDDEDQVLSCLDALSVDMRVLEAAISGGTHEIDVEDAVCRFVGRIEAIRALHVELSKKAKVAS